MKTGFTTLIQRKLLMLVFFFAALSGYGQSSKIEGYILENGQTPVPMATITVKGTNKGAITDTSGYFSIKTTDTNNVSVLVSCVGYSELEYVVNPGTQNSIIIEKKVISINQVEVTGYRMLMPIEDPTVEPLALRSSVQPVSVGQIHETGAVNVIEALKYTVAGNLSEQGRKRKNFYSVRGQSSSEYAIDGVSLYQFMDAPNALSANMVSGVEITRSSNALLLGYSGLTGVVNIKTRSFDSLTTMGEVEYGTFNKLHANITHGGCFGDFRYALSVSKDMTDGPEGRNAAENMWNVYGKLQYIIKNKLEISLQHFYMSGMREFAQMQNENANVSPANRAMIWRFDPLAFNVTTAKVKYFAGKFSTTELQFYNIDSKRDWVKRAYYVARSKDPETQAIIQTVTDSIPPYETVSEPDHVIGGGLFQTFSFAENNYLRIAVKGSQRTTPSQTNPSGTVSNTDIRSYSAILLDEHSFGKLSLNGGVKIIRDFYKKYAPGNTSLYIEDEWQPFTTSINLGGSYSVTPGLLLTALVSGGTINAPLKAAAQIITSEGDTTESSVNDEQRLNIDFGIVKSLGSFGDVTLTAFYIERKNAWEYSGVLYTDNSGIQREYFNNLDLKSYGIDVLWNSDEYFRMFSFNANTSLIKSYELTEGSWEKYEDSPEIMINGSFNVHKYGIALSIYGKYISEYTGERFVMKSSSDEKIYVGDFVNVDIYLGYEIPKTPVSIYGRVINLGDVKYTTTSPVYPDFGRQFSIGVKACF